MTPPVPESRAQESPAPELARPVSLAQIGTLGMLREVTATADECAAIAARLLIPAVGALSCRFQLLAQYARQSAATVPE